MSASAPQTRRTGPLKILHLEDNDLDAELIKEKLVSGGLTCEIEQVRTREQFEEAVQGGRHDLILSDFSMPGFNGLAALELARRHEAHAPFIFISGTIGEERAVESLVVGATDYILKQNLNRLLPSVQRALAEVAARDEQRLLERQLLQAQKMEIVGRLAGGVAHDFNNLLTAILGLSELAIRELPEGSATREDLEEIKATALRAAQLTKQLLAFSRKQMIEPRVVDLGLLVANIEKMLRRIIGEHIDLVVTSERGLEPVFVDPGQIEQLVVNLAVNARDAMPGGGTLSIHVRGAAVSRSFAEAHPGAKAGDFVLLTVRDTGTGMSDEVKAHLFEPFFTTKEPGKGTGLGLATCYGVVKQNAGYIAVESAVGAGTTFSVYLPKTVKRPDASAGGGAPGATGGQETILVVEDDALLRRLTARRLRLRGYEVLEAGDLAEAREVFEAAQGRIRLLLTDVVMPNGGGKQLADALKRLRPGISVLFISGYTDDTITQQGIVAPDVNFLGKPFTDEQLALKVREVLDAPRLP